LVLSRVAHRDRLCARWQVGIECDHAYPAQVTSPSISISELRTTLANLLDSLENQLGPRVDLGADYYWTIDPDAAYHLERDPASGPTVGQLSDDVATVRETMVGGVEPAETWHVLRHVNGILARLAWLSHHAEPGS
jgi:hypothetical protein